MLKLTLAYSNQGFCEQACYLQLLFHKEQQKWIFLRAEEGISNNITELKACFLNKCTSAGKQWSFLQPVSFTRYKY